MWSYYSSLDRIENPSVDQCASAKFDISYTLLPDVILMEVRALAMKFASEKKREEKSIRNLWKLKILTYKTLWGSVPLMSWKP